MVRTIDKEQHQRLRVAIQQTIQALTTVESNLPLSVETLYQDIPHITDGLLDELYKILMSSETHAQALFPVSGVPPVLDSEERQALIEAAQIIERRGAELVALTLNSPNLTAQRQAGSQSDITGALKSILVSVCTLSDFTFPTYELIQGDPLGISFRVIVNGDLEHVIE
ncbi:hypothetical protein [Deinococcus radiophilus]|uniref:Uncharacterized protein n=1 Tax=Deinococcus radiophilus TaxID=32062 RepID=A0A3S0JFJ9_9DEIO|nr:hypothetical protein [Deinococcus radiophilus]RTR16628.1 hypothetical protein EJ104_13845 [Deinococcus radiophilus]